MTIASADLKFLPAERATDVLTSVAGQGGGGYASSPVVQDNVSNNAFPNVMPADRTTGRRQLRRVFPAVLSNENSLAASVGLAFSARQTDANVEVCAFLQTGITAVQQRSAYWAGFGLDTFGQPFAGVLLGTAAVVTTNTGDFQTFAPGSGIVAGTTFKVGDKVAVKPVASGGDPTVQWRTITALNAGAGTMSFSGTFAFTAATSCNIYLQRDFATKVVAPALTTGSLTAGDQDIAVDRLEVRVATAAWAPTTPGYVATNPLATEFAGKIPAFRVGARVLIQHPSTPATREIKVIEFVNYQTGVVRLTAGLTNSYPSNTIVCMLLEVGDLQAAVSLAPFAQQAWNRVWQDTALGAPISPRFTGAISMNNAGGIEERWVVEFTSTTAFKLTGERLGQIATGNTSSDFIPLNPYTSQPYFTLPATGWGSGWLPGNVLRFNTVGAHSGVWASRVTSPSSAAGTVHADMLIAADV
jgi:hypothetical protein